MKKQKLSLEKFRIVKLKDSSSIFGGTGTTDSTITDDPAPTRTCKTFPPPPSIDPNDPYGECGG